MSKVEDRRIKRTRNMIVNAFIDLMIEKGYEKITIQDIVDRANVGRSTFYSHFVDKEELLLHSINELREFLKEHCISSSLNKETDKYRLSFSLLMIQHVQSHKRMYKAVSKEKGAVVTQYIREMLSELTHEDIALLLAQVSSNIPKKIVIDHVLDTFMMLLTWWLDNDMPCSAQEFNDIFHKLVFKGIDGLIDFP